MSTHTHTQHILQKAREIAEHEKTLAENDKSFTPEIIDTLFCNIEEILAFHRELMTQLNSCLGSKGAAYDTQIAQCYVSKVCVCVQPALRYN